MLNENKLKKYKNLIASLLVLFFGILFLWQSLIYRIGTAEVMGPGYYPLILSTVLTAIGLSLLVKSVYEL